MILSKTSAYVERRLARHGRRPGRRGHDHGDSTGDGRGARARRRRLGLASAAARASPSRSASSVARNFIGWDPDRSTTTTTCRPTGPPRSSTATGSRSSAAPAPATSTSSSAPATTTSRPATVSGGVAVGARVKRVSDGKIFRYAPSYDYTSNQTLTGGLAVGATCAARVEQPCLPVHRHGARGHGRPLDAGLHRHGQLARSSPPRRTSRAENFGDTSKWRLLGGAGLRLHLDRHGHRRHRRRARA